MSRVPRVFVPGPIAAGQRLKLEGEAAAHLGRVLRARSGDAVVLFDGRGPEHEAEIVTAGRRGIELMVGAGRDAGRESPLQLVLLQGISRPERMDWVLRKAAELGVVSLRPVMAERSVVKLDAERAARRLHHWQAILVSACEQCGRNRLPELLEPLPLDAALSAHAGAQGVLLDPEADRGPDSLPVPTGPLCLLVGPEGGLDVRERAAAHAAGYIGVRLGPRILRTETAAIAGIALLQARFGDLK
jgi:16S rRNA (uracil1498-N3)-methyltransferase